MTVCCVIGCKTRSDTRKQTGSTLHKFPKRADIRQAWIDAVNREKDWNPSNCSVVCCLHFEKSCFEIKGKYTKLRPDAVPTLIERNPPYYKNQRKFHKMDKVSKNLQFTQPTKDASLAARSVHVKIEPGLSENNKPTEEDIKIKSEFMVEEADAAEDVCITESYQEKRCKQRNTEEQKQHESVQVKKQRLEDIVNRKEEQKQHESVQVKKRRLEDIVNKKRNGQLLQKLSTNSSNSEADSVRTVPTPSSFKISKNNDKVVGKKKSLRSLRKGNPKKLPLSDLIATPTEVTEVVTYIVTDHDPNFSEIEKLLPEIPQGVRHVTQNENLYMGLANNKPTSVKGSVGQTSSTIPQSFGSVVQIERQWDSQEKKDLLNKLLQLEIEVVKLRKDRNSAKEKVKSLEQQQCQDAERIAALQNSVESFKQHKCVNREKEEIFNNLPTTIIELLDIYKCERTENISREYSPELFKFINSLHSISPDAYKYVRKVFGMSLPSEKTILKWKAYDTSGFTESGSDDDKIESTNEQCFSDEESNGEISFTDEESNCDIDFSNLDSNWDTDFRSKENKCNPDFTNQESNYDLDLMNEGSDCESDFTDEESNCEPVSDEESNYKQHFMNDESEQEFTDKESEPDYIDKESKEDTHSGKQLLSSENSVVNQYCQLRKEGKIKIIKKL